MITTITHAITNDHRPRPHCLGLFVDMRKAFDTVARETISEEMVKLAFPPRYVRWVRHFMQDRVAAAQVCGERSAYYALTKGVPQGSVLSPILFNLAMNKLAREIEEKAKHGNTSARLAMYADDIALLISGEKNKVKQTAENLLKEIEDIATGMGMSLSRTKTCYAQFGTHQQLKKHPLALQYADGTAVPHEKTPKYLGVTLDPTLSFKSHVLCVLTRFAKRFAIVRMLGGTTWGATAHTLRAAYLTYVHPVITYALGIWGPHLSTTLMDLLEQAHRKAARLITGLPQPTPAATLLWEAHLETVTHTQKIHTAIAYEGFRRAPHTPGYAASTQETLSGWRTEAIVTVDVAGGFDAPAAPTPRHLPVHPWLWEPLKRLTIDPTILGDLNRSRDGILRDLTMQHLAALPLADLQVYTDGSVTKPVRKEGERKAKTYGGAGIVLYKPGESTPLQTRSVAAGLYACSYHAELTGIKEALECLLNRKDTFASATLMTDSQSALRAFELGPARAKEKIEHEIWEKLAALTEKEKTIHLQWTPGHIGIAGNEDRKSVV